MGVFRQPPAEIEGKHALPVIEITFEKVRKVVDSRIPDNVCLEIVKSEKPLEKIKEVNKAAEEISEAAGGMEVGGFEALKNEAVGRRFVENPQVFVEIAKAAGEGANATLYALENEHVGKWFAENPQAFVEIAKAAGGKANKAFWALGEWPEVGRRFAENPQAFVEIAKAVGEEADGAFWALGTERAGKLFAENPQVFVEIAKAVGEEADGAFWALGNEAVGRRFAENPQVVIDAFREIAKAAGKGADGAFGAICNGAVGRRFAENPQVVIDAFREIAKAAGGKANTAFWVLGEQPEVGRRFAENPQVVIDAFREIAKAAGEGAFGALKNEAVGRRFVDYCDGKISFMQLEVSLSLDGSYAIESGRRLDDLHERPVERSAFLVSLNESKVVGLLCSNPELFYTSSNHMLFDRLQNDMDGNGLKGLKEKYALDEKQLQNLFFRAINYDRLYGRENSIATKDELGMVYDVISSGLHAEKYDPQYFYLFANALDKIQENLPQVREDLKIAAGDAKDGKIRLAAEFLLENMGKNFAGIKFDGNDYAANGKVQVLQVFDKEDTGNDHWIFTQNWFEAQMGKPKEGANGEMVYEDKTSRVVLFMGDEESNNQEFAKSWMQENGRGIITFRGHSFSLEYNMPYDIFSNMEGKFLFIPGSCGSAGSIPSYMEANPKTDITFFSNTSTGRGQVTNALIDLLLAQQKPATYDAILKKGASEIEQNGGDVATIKTITLGYLLMKHVQENSRSE